MRFPFAHACLQICMGNSRQAAADPNYRTLGQLTSMLQHKSELCEGKTCGTPTLVWHATMCCMQLQDWPAQNARASCIIKPYFTPDPPSPPSLSSTALSLLKMDVDGFEYDGEASWML